MNQKALSLAVVKSIYESHPETSLDNESLYNLLAKKAGVRVNDDKNLSRIGKAGDKHNLIKRKVRWFQQSLKHMGIIEKTPKKGVWSLTEDAKKGLNFSRSGVKLVAYSTDLGVAIWGDNVEVLQNIDEPIHLCMTSPPYPLRVSRNYGNVSDKEYANFVVRSLEPIVKSLAPGGSIVLNVSNDIFEHKSPSRSYYIERMTLAIHDELGLYLMDRWPWINPSKPPNPTWWACRERVQLCSGYEPVFWFTNDPHKIRSNNNRVLEPHSESHKKLMAKGGDQRSVKYGDGAYTLRPGSFGNETKGKIPKNYFIKGHACKDSRELRRHALSMGLPPHGAMFPTSLADFAIDFLTEENDLVIDHFSGSNKVGLSAERKNRRWIAIEKTLQYIRVQAEMFRDMKGFHLTEGLELLTQ